MKCMRISVLLALLPAVPVFAQYTAVSLILNGSGTGSTSGAGSASGTVGGTVLLSPYGNGTFTATLAGQMAGGNASYSSGTFAITVPGGMLRGTLNFKLDPVVLGTTASTFSGATASISEGTGAFTGATGGFTYLSGSAFVTGYGSFVFSLSGPGTVVLPSNAPTALRLVPVPPCRVADTRNPAGPFGGPLLNAGGVREFAIPQSACGIPANAQAYVLNLTVVPQAPLNYVTLWPTGQGQPLVSTLNSLDGRIRANMAIVPAGSNGKISVFATDATHVILDVSGYFQAPSANDLSFYPVAPCRVADTRIASQGKLGMAAGEVRQFQVLAANCGLPTGGAVQAYSFNITSVPQGALGYITVWPSGQAQPLVSTLNSPTGTIVANAAIVPAGDGGAVSVFTTDPVNVVIDVNGYFATPGPGGLSFYGVNPCRVSDTRNATAPLGGPRLEGGVPRSLPLAGSACQLPATAQAYSLNSTVVPAAPLNYLTLWPAGTAQPFVSTLNALDRGITANAALVPAGSGAAISAFATDPTHLVLDVNGYFAP